MRRWPFVVALVLMVGAGLLLGSMSRAEATVIRKPFAEFPLDLDGWTGVDLRMEPRVLDLLKLSDYVLRSYTPPRTGAPADAGVYEGQLRQVAAPVHLYVGYYGSQRTGSTYHSPKNCLPGAGWSIESSTAVKGVVPGAPGAAVNRVVIGKGFDKQLILYWYQDRGRIVASEYDAKAYLIWDAMTRNRTDGSLVRISTPIIGSDEDAYRHAIEFLHAAWKPLNLHLPG